MPRRGVIAVRKCVEMGVYLWETLLALFVLVSVILGTKDLFLYLSHARFGVSGTGYSAFQAFVSHVLLLVVGLELAIMLIRHTPGSLIEVLLYVIARKLLVPGATASDFVLGVASIVGLFATRKYLFVSKIDVREHIMNAATPVHTVNDLMDTHLPENVANTLGGLIVHVAGEERGAIMPGARFHVADTRLEVVEVVDGLIRKVKVTRQERGDI
ncbi:MAG TPA: hypothetical protein GX506_05755 [Firmicutes bacterium]|nr:hypothetical protein [Bacillota bacterium]